jgi:hypothetical protein
MTVLTPLRWAYPENHGGRVYLYKAESVCSASVWVLRRGDTCKFSCPPSFSPAVEAYIAARARVWH